MKGGLIGFGYWAKILAKSLKDSKKNLYVFDISKQALKSAEAEGFKTLCSLEQILHSKEIQFVIIATPPDSHCQLVHESLNFNKHVLVEKPFGSYLKDKSFLFKKARKKKKVLMVDYTYVYSPGFQKLKKFLASAKMKSYESLRLNKNFPRGDVHLVEDLVIHDLSMLVEIIPSPPLYCFCQPLDKPVGQSALFVIKGDQWGAFVYASSVFGEKKRAVLVNSSKKEIEFREENGQAYVRYKFCKPQPDHLNKNLPSDSGFIEGSKNTMSSKEALKSKSSLELMFEEFFNRIKKPGLRDDFLRYKKINTLLKAGFQSMERKGQSVKIPKL